MGRRRKKGRPISGWVVLDKPYDFGSTEAVSKIKWLFQAQKAGHAGTLDPQATGILPIALGEATKTAPFITDAHKVYRFTARWGEATRTDDAEGEVVERSDKRPTIAEIEAVLPDFTGEIDQIPPQFSAIKIKGERAYDLAREGEEVALEARRITIHDLKVVATPSENETVFEAKTGKGAYVRALVRDIAKALGALGHVVELRRLAVGPLTVDDAITVEALEALDLLEDRDKCLLPITDALSHLPQAAIEGPQAEKLRRGQPAILTPAAAKGARAGETGAIETVLATMHGEAVALCALDGLKLKPSRVFNS